jgi:glucoamylase
MQSPIAPGAPGIPPTWCSSDKTLVGTAMGPARLWYTLGHGILNEIYYPRIDIPQIRDLGFIVADDAGFWVEVKRQQAWQMQLPASGIPLPTLIHRHARFTLTLRVCPDPERDVLLIQVELTGDAGLHPYLLLSPRLGGSGYKNLAWAETHRGRRVLWAEQGPFGLALLAADSQFADALLRTSVGHVGVSDLWQAFAAQGRMTDEYAQAGPGNVALAGKLTRQACIALAFSTSREAAATQALAALSQSFDGLFSEQTSAWQAWHQTREARTPVPPLPTALADQYRTSAMILKCHRDKTFTGAMVASLSIPWGSSGEERGGYHLVWPRDLVESATALLALGGEIEARNVLRYLIATQNEDGHWHQNQWLGGKAYWSGIQLDETAFPVLLATALAERDALQGVPVFAMVRRALDFLIRQGPVSPQDRWEEDAGVNAFTLSICIAALVAGAALLAEEEANICLMLADYWNARLEDWTATRQGRLGERYGIPAYYVREAPADVVDGPTALNRSLPIKNHGETGNVPANEQISLDFLQLVRLGLRDANDPLIRDSVRLADSLLASETPVGRVWHRYTNDGYGEHADGGPFDGTGVGRGWPLLSGERGHYALACGEDPLAYLDSMSRMAGSGGLLPEQVWESDPLPALGLLPGRPTGSAMPLAWAHAEFVKLAASRQLGRIFDRPALVWQRYAGKRPDPATWIWTSWAPIDALPRDKSLLLLFTRPVQLHLGFDGWSGAEDMPSREMGFDLQGLCIDAARLYAHRSLEFTWRWLDDGQWLGQDHQVKLQLPV